MPQLKNQGYSTLAIQVSDDDQIVLGPRETKDISIDEFDSEGVQKSLRDGLAMVLASEEQPAKRSKPKPIST
jgi:hypothetical protein